MNLDERLRMAADDVRRGVAGITPPEPRRHGFGRVLALAAAVVAAFVAVSVLVVIEPGGDVAATSAPSTTAGDPATTVTTLTETTVPEDTSSVPSTTVPVTTTVATPVTSVVPGDLPEPIPGWERVFLDDGTFGAVAIADAVALDGSVVAVGCTADGSAYPGGPPVWTSDDAGRTWTAGTGPSTPCLGQVVATPFGLFAGGPALVRSLNGGATWAPVEILELGSVADRLLPVGDRLVVITSRASLNESREAELVVTSDGENWETITADVFDSSDMLDAIEGGPGLLVVGASPGGEFVPTAAVWASSDGLTWSVVTPSGEGFAGARMTSIVSTPDGFVAVGYDFDGTSLMAAWTSPDGVTWSRSPSPRGDEAAQFGFMGADALTYASNELYAVGTDFDAGRDEESTSIPAIWSSVDGITWIADISYDLAPKVPFHIAGDVGFWPPRGWAGVGIDNVVQVFTATG